MAISVGVLRFAQGTDVTLDIRIIGVRADISPSGANWLFALTVRVDPSDADPAIYDDIDPPTFVVNGDADNDPVIRYTISDTETDSWAITRQAATADGLYEEHTHVFDVWRTNSGSESQLVYGSILVDEPVRTIT